MRAPGDDPGKLARHCRANGERTVRLPIESGDQWRHIILRLRNIHACQADAFRAGRVRSQPIKPALEKLRELRKAARRSVEESVEPGQPERGNLCAVNAAPPELGRQFVVWNSATKPEGFEARLPQELRHLGMMPERVEQPRHSDLNAELLAAIPFAILHLPHEQLAARFDHVRHHVHPPDDLEPALGDKLAKRRSLFRVTLQERLEIRDLIEREFVIGILLQQLQRLQNVRQSHLQITFPRFENGALPVCVRNVVERGFVRDAGGLGANAGKNQQQRVQDDGDELALISLCHGSGG